MAIMREPTALVTLIDSIPALVAYIDCNMILQFCNKRFKHWFSLEGDVHGKSFPTVSGKQIFSQLQRHMGKVLVGDRAHFQISAATPNGVQYMDATLSPDFDPMRRVRGFIFHSTDVTEKNRTERALKDYFENAAIGLHWVDANGIITWANPAELRMLGYREEEYIGHHISEFHSKGIVVEDILGRLANRENIKNLDADLICKDGSVKHVTINSTALFEGDKFIHTRCFTIDVTERKLAAKAVKESEEQFKMMATLAPLVIWTTGENGDCNFLSVKWEELTGKPVHEGYGRRWSNFIHPDDRENTVNSWLQSFSLKKPFEAKFRFLDATGGYRVTYVNSNPRYNGSGEFGGYIGILQDISSEEKVKYSLEKIVMDRTEDLRKRNAELKQAEKTLLEKNNELEKINNQLSSFAHIASHDLQEPLRKIQTFSNLLFLQEGDKFSDRGKDLYRRIHDSSDRMRKLIQDLLAFSKSTNNEYQFEVVDLNALLNEVISELEVQIADKKATVENLGLPKLPVIKFQFHQLFLNLLSNAIKFSGTAPPHIVIKSEILDNRKVVHKPGVRGKSHHITVSDNGIGFEPQFSEKIFEIFHRLHGRIQYEGTGIGLAICRKIMENHNGFIVAEGQVNEGATFHIYLPVDEEKME